MPPNPYYDHSGFPQTNTRASSALMRAELDAVEQGFDKLPVLSGNGSEIVTVKADATGLESKTQVELHLVRDDGDTYTGAHDFTGATVSLSAATASTQVASDNSTKVATTAFVNSVAMNAALPAQSIGDAGKYIQTDGTNASWSMPSVVLDRLPIFSVGVSAKECATVLEDISLPIYSTGLTGSATHTIYGNSLFIATSSTSQANVASSPDAVTWTLRGMPSSQTWKFATNGTNKFVATVAASTVVASSTNGTVWASATALPANSSSSNFAPAFNGNICLVFGQTVSTCFISSDNGATWGAAQTIPANTTTNPFVVGGLFWYFASGTTAYTSSTGETGSWTSRTIPVSSPSSIHITPSGALSICGAAAGSVVYETTNGIDWTDSGMTTMDTTAPVKLNTIPAVFSSTFGNSGTCHNGKWIKRSSRYSWSPNNLLSVSGGGVICFPAGASGVMKFDPNGVGAITAIFEA